MFLPPNSNRRDYRRIEHLDNYEAEGLEDDAEEVLDEEGLFAARAAAEREIDERERRRTGQALPRALEGESSPSPSQQGKSSGSSVLNYFAMRTGDDDDDDSQAFRRERDRRSRRRGVSPALSDHEEDAQVMLSLSLSLSWSLALPHALYPAPAPPHRASPHRPGRYAGRGH